MHPLLLQLVLLGNLVAVGALLVIQPRIARRGLLFGVYVGEERWAGADAARITRTWYLGMAAIAALSLAAGEAVIFLQPVKPLGIVVALVVLSVLSSAVYLVVYLQARKMALPGQRAAAAALAADSRWSLALPLSALVVGVAGGVLVIYAIGGSLYLAIRYGQRGARLERSVGAPLTNGLADNTHWVLGAFYVNRHDPSVFVEKRFGLGYTINFGNPIALAMLVVFLAIVLAIVLTSAFLPQSQTPPR